MAKKNKTELKDLSIVELQQMSQTLAREVFDLRNTLALQRKLEKPHLLKATRRQRSRVLGLLTKKQNEGVAV